MYRYTKELLEQHKLSYYMYWRGADRTNRLNGLKDKSAVRNAVNSMEQKVTFDVLFAKLFFMHFFFG
jgi:hypothetical protein